MGSSGKLTDAAMLVESFLRRATTADMASIGVSEVEAWSLLGRIHAMNEKEDKALSAFEQGRKVMVDSHMNDQVAGEMLMVSITCPY
jgi:peroxin-5